MYSTFKNPPSAPPPLSTTAGGTGLQAAGFLVRIIPVIHKGNERCAECRLFCCFAVPGGGRLISLSRRGGVGTTMRGGRAQCCWAIAAKGTRKRPLHQNAARRQQGDVSRSNKYGRDVPWWLFTGPRRSTPGIAHCFQAGPWRRRASLAGVAGGRR